MDYREILGEFEPPRAIQKTKAPLLPWEESAGGLAKWLKPPVYGTQPENQAFLENIVGDMPALEKALRQVPKPEPVIVCAPCGGRSSQTRGSFRKTVELKKAPGCDQHHAGQIERRAAVQIHPSHG
jgi:hypothetical protein